ncbi:ankyrin repeat domain-containing protein 63-like [Rhinatrema bivittatum]|uniref:ankyrin repeat domain-containing protein 63-like n=1 Tax=Rhinatrema bivittatum TaxID=194408 RepID=UPI00112C2204|nr:ankyrin repeat domain-containing protein 63-like [Rhinatrema bivittatum]
MLKLSESAAEERSGARALLDAMAKDQAHLARFLLDALDGRLVNARTERARTPLIAAALLPTPRARATYLKLLLERGAHVNCQDSAGRTALSHACERGHLDAVQALVQRGADPELPDAWGNTSLLYAAAGGHAPVLRFLVRAFKRLGLQLDRTNSVGNSALEVAKHLGHRDCVRALGGCRGEESCRGGSPEEERPQQKEEEVAFRPGCVPRSLAPRRRLESMDSVEEEVDRDWERGPESSCSAFTSALVPGLLSRSWSVQYGRRGREVLPPLAASSNFPRLGSPLRILLTPLASSQHRWPEKDGAGPKRFPDTYYQKRSSLPSVPCGVLPPDDRVLPAACKSLSPTPAASVALLGSRLLRRFTFPELRKPAAGAPQPGPRAMARSETFPLSRGHPQVGTKPNIDSISAVRCEFDFHPQSAS